ncbi:MAG TPA: tetratricopeptide repeat protein [Gemmatimonadales bacterium]
MASSSEIEKLERRWSENQLGLTFAPLAEAYRKAGNPARALELLQAGMAQHPNYIPAHIVRGRCYLDTQADAEAELAFLRVTELDPENVIALKSLAEISERAGRLPEAIRRLESLLDIDRNNEEARGQLDRVREISASPVAAGLDARPTPETGSAAPGELSLEEDTLDVVDRQGSDDLVPTARSNEFQLPSDAETLVPTGDRLDEVELLGEVPEFDLPEEGLSEGDTYVPVKSAEPPSDLEQSGVVSVGDFSSAMAYEPARMELPEPPAAELEPELIPPPPAAEPEPQPVVMEVPVPIVDVVPPPPPPPPVEAAPAPSLLLPRISEPEPAREEPEPREPEVAEQEEAAASGEPELVVTETMAEIFLRQGHRELALAVYAQLAQRDPGNSRIAAAYSALRAELAPPVPPAPEPEPLPRFAARETGGRSVHQTFQELLAASRPAMAAGVHPPAFEAARRPAGEPTRPAQDTLSLSAVFGDEASPSRPAGAQPAPATGEPSFDEFFAPGGSADAELPRPPGGGPDTAASQVPEDLEQFNAWLRGLKR